MKVKANVVIEINEDDLKDIGRDTGEVLEHRLKLEVEEAIMASEVWHGLKRTVYHAVLDKLREEVAKEFIDKIKGGK